MITHFNPFVKKTRMNILSLTEKPHRSTGCLPCTIRYSREALIHSAAHLRISGQLHLISASLALFTIRFVYFIIARDENPLLYFSASHLSIFLHTSPNTQPSHFIRLPQRVLQWSRISQWYQPYIFALRSIPSVRNARRSSSVLKSYPSRAINRRV